MSSEVSSQNLHIFLVLTNAYWFFPLQVSSEYSKTLTTNKRIGGPACWKCWKAGLGVWYWPVAAGTGLGNSHQEATMLESRKVCSVMIPLVAILELESRSLNASDAMTRALPRTRTFVFLSFVFSAFPCMQVGGSLIENQHNFLQEKRLSSHAVKLQWKSGKTKYSVKKEAWFLALTQT